MVMEAPLSRPGHVVAAPAAPPVPAEIPWTRIDIDLYEVSRCGYIVGYVEVVGSVFVALGGTRYDRAIEIAQELTFHASVEAVLRRSA